MGLGYGPYGLESWTEGRCALSHPLHEILAVNDGTPGGHIPDGHGERVAGLVDKFIDICQVIPPEFYARMLQARL